MLDQKTIVAPKEHVRAIWIHTNRRLAAFRAVYGIECEAPTYDPMLIAVQELDSAIWQVLAAVAL
jgi:hypothetical protein